MICIYCLKDKNKEHFQKVEHVLPQSFGTYEENFTLLDTVCDECNQYFGDNLEIYLARDTYEGIQRYKFNIQNPAQFKTMGGRSELTIRIEEGEIKGAYVYLTYSEVDKDVIIKPLKQIGFKKLGLSEYDFYLINELKNINTSNYDLKGPESIILFGIYPSEASEVLKNIGINNFVYSGEARFNTNHHNYLCRIEGTIHERIQRAVCKIAFNYLAFWEGRDFVLKDCFSEIRKFILNGVRPNRQFIKIKNDTLLIEEIEKGMNVVGHFITTEWIDSVTLFARVSLLNMFFYEIELTDNYNDEYRDILRGHLFNPNMRQIHRIGRM